MAKRVGKEAEFRKLTASLREFVNSLPNESEKGELHRSITAIIDFLTGIQHLLSVTPAREDTLTVENALRTLDQFAERTKGSPGIAMLLGIPQPRPPRTRTATYTSEEAAAAQQLLSELQTLPIDQMRSRLQDVAAVPLRTLQAAALQLGLRSVQRMGRDVLEHQVASKIANYRGYQGLRAGMEGA